MQNNEATYKGLVDALKTMGQNAAADYIANSKYYSNVVLIVHVHVHTLLHTLLVLLLTSVNYLNKVWFK